MLLREHALSVWSASSWVQENSRENLDGQHCPKHILDIRVGAELMGGGLTGGFWGSVCVREKLTTCLLMCSECFVSVYCWGFIQFHWKLTYRVVCISFPHKNPLQEVFLDSSSTVRHFFLSRLTTSSWRKEASVRSALLLLSSFLSKPWLFSLSPKTTWSLVWKQVSASRSWAWPC